MAKLFCHGSLVLSHFLIRTSDRLSSSHIIIKEILILFTDKLFILLFDMQFKILRNSTLLHKHGEDKVTTNNVLE